MRLQRKSNKSKKSKKNANYDHLSMTHNPL